MMKLYDFYFHTVKGAVKHLRDAGVNAFYLNQGCHPKRQMVPYFNNFQKQN
jgi:hypothetical protein